MQLKEAFHTMIRKYWQDEEPASYNKVAGERKYTKKYFDSVAEEAKDVDEELT